MKTPQFTIRKLLLEDAKRFEQAFAEQGWTKPESQYVRYYEEQERGERQVFVAEMDGLPVGYVCLLPGAPAGPYYGMCIPCVSDFNVLIKNRGQGIGSALMDAVEEAAFKQGDEVCLGVGMHSGYGTALRMYVKRGYIPDGSGLWYQDKPLTNYAPCVNDDDLVLYLLKVKPRA